MAVRGTAALLASSFFFFQPLTAEADRRVQSAERALRAGPVLGGPQLGAPHALLSPSLQLTDDRWELDELPARG